MDETEFIRAGMASLLIDVVSLCRYLAPLAVLEYFLASRNFSEPAGQVAVSVLIVVFAVAIELV